MIIYSPEIEVLPTKKVRLSCDFDTKGERQTLWYEFDEKWKDYLVIEQADAFLVGLLLLALKNKENIQIETAVSNKLLYQLNNYLIPILVHVFEEFKTCQITALEKSKLNLSGQNTDYYKIKGAATGVSCGVDSFSTIKRHLELEGELKIKYLTFFNAGSNGDYGGTNARELFHKRLKGVKRFTDEVGLSLIAVDSNISELLNMSFVKTDSLRNLSCTLAIQKLFTNYYYSSAFKFSELNFNSKGMHNYDLIFLSYLNTETTSFYPSMIDKTREERTSDISSYKYAWKHLDVCTSSFNTVNKKNCSKCHKCMRTQLTLDVINRLNHFDKVFDIDTYKKNVDSYISYLLAKKDLYVLDKTLLVFLKNNGFKITLKHKLLSKKIVIKRSINKIKSIFKNE